MERSVNLCDYEKERVTGRQVTTCRTLIKIRQVKTAKTRRVKREGVRVLRKDKRGGQTHEPGGVCVERKSEGGRDGEARSESECRICRTATSCIQAQNLRKKTDYGSQRKDGTEHEKDHNCSSLDLRQLQRLIEKGTKATKPPRQGPARPSHAASDWLLGPPVVKMLANAWLCGHRR